MATLSGRANEKRRAKLLNMQMSFAFLSPELLNGFSPGAFKWFEKLQVYNLNPIYRHIDP